VSALLVSDREREHTVGLLRRHWLSGRLTADEFEERVDEAWRARFAADLWHALRWLPVEAPPAAPARHAGSRSGTASFVLGICAVSLFFLSFGLLFFFTLPLAVIAWALGRDARRSAPPDRRGRAVAGEALGIAGTLLSLMPFVALVGLFGLLL
jgi:cbb3-type cytochrome oxidase subunit 3